MMSEVSKAKLAAQVPKPIKKKRLKWVPATEYGLTEKKSGQEKKQAFQNIRLVIYQKLQVLY